MDFIVLTVILALAILIAMANVGDETGVLKAPPQDGGTDPDLWLLYFIFLFFS